MSNRSKSAAKRRRERFHLAKRAFTEGFMEAGVSFSGETYEAAMEAGDVAECEDIMREVNEAFEEWWVGRGTQK